MTCQSTVSFVGMCQIYSIHKLRSYLRVTSRTFFALASCAKRHVTRLHLGEILTYRISHIRTCERTRRRLQTLTRAHMHLQAQSCTLPGHREASKVVISNSTTCTTCCTGPGVIVFGCAARGGEESSGCFPYCRGHRGQTNSQRPM